MPNLAGDQLCRSACNALPPILPRQVKGSHWTHGGGTVKAGQEPDHQADPDALAELEDIRAYVRAIEDLYNNLVNATKIGPSGSNSRNPNEEEKHHFRDKVEDRS